MTEPNSSKRVTCKRPQPNQRFQELLESLYKKAVIEKSPMVSALKQAIQSLEKYPLPLTSGAECSILKGFDHKLCQYIDAHIHAQNKKTKVVAHASNSCDGSSSKSTPCVNVDLEVEMGSLSAKTHIKKSNKDTNTGKYSIALKFRGAGIDNVVIRTTNSCEEVSSPSPSLDHDSEAEKASAPLKNQKKKRNLVINRGKCSFHSKLSEGSINNLADQEATSSEEGVSRTSTCAGEYSKPKMASASTKIKIKKRNFVKSTNSSESSEAGINNIVICASTSYEEGGSEPLSSVNEASEAEFVSASTTNTSKKKNVLTNTVKCSFTSKFNEDSEPEETSLYSLQVESALNDPNVDNSDPTLESKSKNTEKNNNTITSHCSDEACVSERKSGPFDTFFVNRNIDIFKDNWESLTNKYTAGSKCTYTDVNKCYEPVQVIDPDTDSNLKSDSNSIIEIVSSSDDETFVEPTVHQCVHQCEHNGDALTCKLCKIASAAAAFELYYNKRMKREAEKLKKIVLPRRVYNPAVKTGAYALLVALLIQNYECPYRFSLTKYELIQKAIAFSRQSFIKINDASYCTAWAHMNKLMGKETIKLAKYGSKRWDYYKLTLFGKAIAKALVNEHLPKVTLNDILFQGKKNNRVPCLENIILLPPPLPPTRERDTNPLFIEMPPGTFEIVMLIDKRENINFKPPLCHNSCYKYELRNLNIGDFLWVARSKKNGQELVLPYILERKRMDDLASSIKDGRFHEQKFRLRKCGLNNVIYLIENLSNNSALKCGLPRSTLMQAIANTSVQDDFRIVKTSGINHTYMFLGMLSESISHEFLPQSLRGCNLDTEGRELMTFDFFNECSAKTKPLTIKDTFIKMLLQLKGLSVEKALAITNKYRTPRSIMKAYDRLPANESEMLLADLRYNNFTSKVGPAISKTVYQLFSNFQT